MISLCRIPLSRLASAVLLFPLLAAKCPPDHSGTVIVFEFRDETHAELRVAVTDPETVAAARAFLAGIDKRHIPIGRIEPGAGVDSRYPFHYRSDEVRVAEMAVEVCDGRIMRTPQEVQAFIAGSGGRYCPWKAYPKAIEP